MIESEAQYVITRHWATCFERDAEELQSGRPLEPGVAPEFRAILVAAARSEARRLRQELTDYDEAHWKRPCASCGRQATGLLLVHYPLRGYVIRCHHARGGWVAWCGDQDCAQRLRELEP